MAMTKSTERKLRGCSRALFYWAQDQKRCAYSKCKVKGRSLLPKGTVGDVYDLTVHHLSEDYDHKTRRESKKSKGLVLMHCSCHDSYHITKNKVWEKRKNVLKKKVGKNVNKLH